MKIDNAAMTTVGIGRRIVAIATALVLCEALSCGSSTTSGTPSESRRALTFKEAYRIAAPIAHEWRSDAKLASIQWVVLDGQGRTRIGNESSMWGFYFSSPSVSELTHFDIAIGDHVLRSVETTGSNRDPRVAVAIEAWGMTTDSPEWFSLATAAGGAVPEEGFDGAAMINDCSRQPAPCLGDDGSLIIILPYGGLSHVELYPRFALRYR